MKNSPGNPVNIEWHFKSSPEIIWKAWTDPEMVKQWFGSDPNGKVIHVALDISNGGYFEVTFIDSDGTEHTCFGNYTDIVAHSILKFTWSWKSEPDHRSFITVTITSVPDGTLMKFEHADIDTASAHNYEAGWRSTFKKLDRILKKE
jgi:uncharacterized protein YndB with AHSA1/START domain